MLIAIISDTHDQLPNLRAAIDHCNANNVEIVIHCGDLISPFMLTQLARFAGPVHLVYGNNVGDQHIISSSCGSRFPSITHHGGLGMLEADGLKVAITHYPEMGRALAGQGRFDVVCCGHNHRYLVEEVAGCLVINPGDMLGKDVRPGFCILDSASRRVDRVEVGEKFVLAAD